MRSFILAVDKPVGPTSHDIVNLARRALGTKRIGHTGTLDPFASGLLLLCVEQATRLAEYLGDLRKTYRAVARFDGSSTTDDATGSITSSPQASSDALIRAAFGAQVGEIDQIPSAFSAKKVDGERAYEIARRGEQPDLAPVRVTIYDIRLMRVELPEVEFEVDCSSGTYVRAIARDVGAQVGTGGYLSALRRTAIGPFDVARAVSPDRIAEGEKIPMREAVAHMNHVEIGEAEERALRFGQMIQCRAERGTVIVLHGAEVVAIGESDGEFIKPKKVLPRD